MSDQNIPTDERAAFEAWADKDGYDIQRSAAPYTDQNNRRGDYYSGLTQVAWDSWQARASLTALTVSKEQP